MSTDEILLMAAMWILSLAIGLFLGLEITRIRKALYELKEAIKTKVDKKPEEPENKSALYDPYDPLMRAQEEHDKLMQKLNP